MSWSQMAHMRCVALAAAAAIVLAGPLLGSTGDSDPSRIGDPRTAGEALERLKRLEGTWEGKGGREGESPVAVVHEFLVVASGSVVLEIMDPDGEREVNVYHLDGDDLVMTHYCGGGTQPTMRLDLARATDGSFPFLFVSGRNLDPATDGHMHAAELRILDENRLESLWTAYRNGSPAWSSSFEITRAEGSRPGL